MKVLFPLAVLAALAACDRKPELAAAAAAAVPKANPPAAARVETETYVVALSARAEQGVLTLTARPPLHLNPDYPAAFRPDPGGGVKFDAERVPLVQETKIPCAAKAEDTCEATTTLKYAGGASGTTVSGTVQFSVCEPEKCLIEKVKVASAIP